MLTIRKNKMNAEQSNKNLQRNNQFNHSTLALKMAGFFFIRLRDTF